MSKTGIVKAVMLLLSLAAFFLPLIQALDQYDWNIHALITPIYAPPRIDFSTRFLGLSVEESSLQVNLEVTNKGEIKVVLEGLNATVYAPGGVSVAHASLGQRVFLEPNAAENVAIKVVFGMRVVSALAPFLTGRDSVGLSVNGTLTLSILGSRVVAPINFSFTINRGDLGLAG
ncbi:MAG: hypothetical protein QXH51_07395 [Candidatus Bathyarchaeia archaeon]